MSPIAVRKSSGTASIDLLASNVTAINTGISVRNI